MRRRRLETGLVVERDSITNLFDSLWWSTYESLGGKRRHSERRFHNQKEKADLFHLFPWNQLLVFSDLRLPSRMYTKRLGAKAQPLSSFERRNHSAVCSFQSFPSPAAKTACGENLSWILVWSWPGGLGLQPRPPFCILITIWPCPSEPTTRKYMNLNKK